MERVVDLIDRQARLITGEERLPVDDYVYAKNEGMFSYFLYDFASGTYYFTLNAKYPAIDNYYEYDKGTYTDGEVGVYLNLPGAIRYRIEIKDNMYAKFNPNDANHTASTITFYNIPVSTVLDMEDKGYIILIGDNPVDYHTRNRIDYHRDYVAGEEPL
jgi:hypothetical protein